MQDDGQQEEAPRQNEARQKQEKEACAGQCRSQRFYGQVLSHLLSQDQEVQQRAEAEKAEAEEERRKQESMVWLQI